MSKKLRVLLSGVKTNIHNSDFSIIPINERLIQSITGSNNGTCSNCGCGSGQGTNYNCSNDSCAGTRDSGCNNHK